MYYSPTSPATPKLGRAKGGFTLIEVLIVVSIIGILAVALTISLTHQRQKASNARVKTDLARLKIAFEDYYGDHNCYPPAEWFDTADDCGGNALSPYLAAIPCDRQTAMPYKLEKDSACGTWFKLYGELVDPATDPQAMDQYSPAGSSLGSYGVSSSNTTVSVNFATPTPTPTSSSTPTNYYYCSAINNCSSYNNDLWSCTPNFPDDPNCGSGCATVGSCTSR